MDPGPEIAGCRAHESLTWWISLVLSLVLAYWWARLKPRDLRASSGLQVGKVSPDMEDCKSVVVLGLASFL